MKKGILASYWEGIKENGGAESYSKIICDYFLPEFVTALVLYSALSFLDGYFIGDLKSVSSYGALTTSTTLLHWIIKIGEGLSVGSVILCGMYNGSKEYEKVGATLKDNFWVTVLCGALFSSFLFFGAHWIYWFMGTPESMIPKAIPFLRIRAGAIFFMFIYLSFVGFLRGIKNTKTPMYIFSIGAVVFVFFDYVLIFGKFGFPALKLKGSACAALIQYAVMSVLIIWTVLNDETYKKYSINLFGHATNWQNIRRFFSLSWPVILDKSSIALAYIWIGKLVGPMGKIATASYGVLKDMERFGFLPAVAFAQVITFMVSNDFGAKNYARIKPTIKRVVFLATIFVFTILFLFSLNPKYIISFFDRKGVFTDFSAKVFPLISLFILLDILQIVLAGALRGIGQIRAVMMARIVVIFLIFMPSSFLVAQVHWLSWEVKFVLIYVMFYLGSGLMSLFYFNKFRAHTWKKII